MQRFVIFVPFLFGRVRPETRASLSRELTELRKRRRAVAYGAGLFGADHNMVRSHAATRALRRRVTTPHGNATETQAKSLREVKETAGQPFPIVRWIWKFASSVVEVEGSFGGGRTKPWPAHGNDT